MALQALIFATLLSVAGGWVITAPQMGGAAAACASAASSSLAACALPRHGLLRMEEGEAAAAPAADAAAVSDFTEDLLEALTTDEEPLVEELEEQPAVMFKAEEGAELAPMPSFVNGESVEAMRSKYALHENDTGSTQVQVAVLTARIAYMTKHMQENKKDYASLRGLTSMVTRRRKLLEYMLREDVDEFKRLTSELGIRTNQLLKPKLSGARGRRV